MYTLPSLDVLYCCQIHELSRNADYVMLLYIRSFKGRFRLMHDGKIRRWKEGKRHNAFSKVCLTKLLIDDDINKMEQEKSVYYR